MGSFFLKQILIIYILLFWGFPGAGGATPIVVKHYFDPWTINVCGSSFQHIALVLDWSLGENPAVYTYQKASPMLLSTGYLQNATNPLLRYKQLDSFGLQFKVGPNPFANQIKIQCNQEGIVIHAIQMLDQNGNLFYNKRCLNAGIGFEHTISMYALPTPICYLLIHYSIEQFNLTTKPFQLLQN